MDQIGQPVSPQSAPDAPRGIFRVSVDDKGRMKLPAAIVEYLNKFEEQRKVFVTTFDGLEARIYPIPKWKETEKALEAPGDDSEFRESLARLAAANGQDTDIDAQGRLTLPAELRRAMSLEGQEVRLHCYKGRINMQSGADHDRQLAADKENLPDKLKLLKTRGL